MNCFLLLCLSGLYAEGGVGYVFNAHHSDQVLHHRWGPAGYWRFDANETANPMGRLAVGHEWNPKPQWRISVEVRHESWIGTTLDNGQNSAWVSVRWKPWAK